MPPDVSIIVLSWNVRDLLRACLASLPLGDPACEVIVVDAASSDGSADMVRAEFSGARLIASSENLGYSRGNNLGLRAARGRYLLILNSDTEMTAGALPRMLDYLEAHPQVGVLGPRLILPGGLTQSSRRRFPALWTGFVESTWLQPMLPAAWLDRFYARDLPDEAISEVDWVIGAALLLRREAVEQVGGLDEGFFMYSEELDWCRRIRAAGWKVVYFPQASLFHHEARSSAQAPAATHIRFNRSKVRYYRKYHGALAAGVLRAWLLAQFAVQLGLEWLKGLLGHKPELRRERVRLYWEVLRSGL